MDGGEGAVFLLLFVDAEVVVGLGCDLGEVGDADDLAAGAESVQLLADEGGGGAADVGVDLVEDDGGGVIFFGEGGLDGEEEAGELAAAGALFDEDGGLAFVGF